MIQDVLNIVQMDSHHTWGKCLQPLFERHQPELVMHLDVTNIQLPAHPGLLKFLEQYFHFFKNGQFIVVKAVLEPKKQTRIL